LNSIFITLDHLYQNSTGAESENSIKRVSTYLRGQSILPFYAVHNSNFFIDIWTKTANVVTDWGLSEIFPCILSLSAGKMKVLNIPYCTREPNSETWYNHERYLRMYSNEKVERVTNSLNIIFSNNSEIKSMLLNYINKDNKLISLDKEEKYYKIISYIINFKNQWTNLYNKYKIIREACSHNLHATIGNTNSILLKSSLLLNKTIDSKKSRSDYSSQGN
jgi:hypothetical protein